MQVGLRPLLAFTASYFGLAVAVALIRGNQEFVFYILVMAVLIAVVLSVNRRLHFTRGILWALSFWGLLHLAGGLVPVPATWPYEGKHPVLYSLWLIPNLLKYDQIVHAFGFGVTTWCCWHGIRTTLRSPLGATLHPTFGLMTLCVMGGIGFGALNEVIEFIAVLSVPETNVGGYINTGWDLVANLVGSISAATVIRLRHVG